MKALVSSLVFALGLSAALPLAAQPSTAAAEGGTLRLVVPYPPGGASDRAARLLADVLQPQLGVSVIVENRAGAGGRLAAQQLKREGADTQVLMLANPAVMVVAPLVFKDSGYDPDKDYQPVAQVSSYEFAIAVGPQVPVRQLSHLVAWLKANPEKSNLGVPATGSLPHFFALMLAEQAGASAQVVGYKGTAPLLNDLMGGHVPAAIDTLDSLLSQHEGGKLRILATSGDSRSLPDVPSFKEAGIALGAKGWNVLYAPAAMPAAKVKRLAEAVAKAMAEPGLRAKFEAAKMVPVSAGQAQTQAMLKAYRAQWAPVVQRSGFKAD